MSAAMTSYDHIMKLCSNEINEIPLVDPETARLLLSKLKKNVCDLFSITTEHYINAGEQGVAHFAKILNCIISNVNNASINNLNQAASILGNITNCIITNN